MQYRITHTTKYTYSEPVPVFENKLHLAPRTTACQHCSSYRLMVMPDPLRIDSHADYFGNRVEYFSILNALRTLSVTSTSTVEVFEPSAPVDVDDSPPWEELRQGLLKPPNDAWRDACMFSFASDFVPISTSLAEFAKPSFTPGRPILAAAADLTRRINEQFHYNSRATDISTPVDVVLSQKAGVCQDFAHLQIACLRSLGLAARYVSGYLRTIPPPGKEKLVGADASHAWLSVFAGNAVWVDFDPTNNVLPTQDHVTVAYGRDYGDVCPIQGVFVGGGSHTMSVSVDVSTL
ncbi:MAG: transglutaminase family protein [Planctomycetales bacterium]|nr:transglutaminase family protein [Planctomycetales bacterium]